MERVNNELEYSPKKKATKLHRSRLKRFGMEQCVCLIIIIVFVAAGYLATIFLASEPAINDPVENNDIDELNIPISNVETFPLAPAEGRQRRKQVYNFLLLGKDVGGGNTDTIIVANYDIPNQKVGMISIPRDTAVERTWQSNPKINSAFYGAGVDVLKDEIFHTFGIPIDYYVLVDLKGFVALVDELDGVDVDIPVNMNYDDPIQKLHIHFKKGFQHLDGQATMEAVRYRHDNPNPDGSPGPNQDYTDVGRAAMQRQVLTQLAKKVISWNSIARVDAFLDIFQTYVETDLSTSDMVWFAAHAIQVNVDSDVTQGVLDGRGDARCNGWRWCFVFEPEDILPTLNEQVNPYDQPLTAKDLHLIKSD